MAKREVSILWFDVSSFICTFLIFPSPLHISAPKGMVDVTELLLTKGCSVVCTDSMGLTPALACAPNDDVATCLAMIMHVCCATPAITESTRKSLNSFGNFKNHRLLYSPMGLMKPFFRSLAIVGWELARPFVRRQLQKRFNFYRRIFLSQFKQ